MVAIVDYGMGNLRSVQKALQRLGEEAEVTADAGVIARAPKVVLPGVGAFGAAIRNLERAGLREPVLDAARSGRPFLGICLGLQLLFTESEEMGRHPGLGIIPGRVARLLGGVDPQAPPEFGGAGMDDPPEFGGEGMDDPPEFGGAGMDDPPEFGGAGGAPRPLKIPHIGWNALQTRAGSRLFAGIPQGARVYFVHSYVGAPDDPEWTAATSDYGVTFCAAIERANVFATQFHPEKSGDIGLQILANFARL